MAAPTVPNQIDTDPISVQERFIRQFDCPNPICDESIDITNVNVGTKIQCSACSNVTWLPDYGNKWWQKPISIIGGLLLSFVIGVGASLTANWVESRPSGKENGNEVSTNIEGEESAGSQKEIGK